MRDLWQMTAGRPLWMRLILSARILGVALIRTAAQAVMSLRPGIRVLLCCILAVALVFCGCMLGRSSSARGSSVPVLAQLPSDPASSTDTSASGTDSGRSVMTLRYDDRWIPGENIVSLGDNIPEREEDISILTGEGGVLRASGIGETTVTLGSREVTVRVEPAPLSLLLLIGQSNMEGNEGDPSFSAGGPAGQVYSTYGPSSVKLAGVVGGDERIPLLGPDTADSLTAAALTGPQSRISRSGAQLLFPVDALTTGGGGKGGPDSGLAWGWQRATGEKVWVVNAAHSGSPIADWQPGAADFSAAVALYSAAQRTLAQEVASGHYRMSHMGYFWLQGCSDKEMTASDYKALYLCMHNALCETLRCSLGSLEFGGILMVQANDGTDGYMSWRELAMNGPRTAQYQMGADMTGACSNIYVVSTIMEDWVYDENGQNRGVEEYFLGKYGETLTYELQSGASGLPVPRTPEDVKDTIHYNQVGYNEIGFDASRNMTSILGLISKD